MGKIIAAGHICLDITPVFPETVRGQTTEVLLQPGKLIHMAGANVHTGGSVANTGLALKKLGNDVILLGKIGRDAFGSMVKSIAAFHGTGGLIEDDFCATSYSVVLAIPGQDRIFLHDPGANDSFLNSDIPEEALEEAVLFHFGYPPLMKRMYADEGRELEEMFRRMKEHEIATSLDFAAIDPHSEAAKADWRTILQRVLPYVDFFVPSFEELCFMLDRERYHRLNQGKDMTEGLDLQAEAMPLAEELIRLGCRAVLIKCGTSGMIYKTSDLDAMKTTGRRLGLDAACWANQAGIQPCFKADIVRSGTGAGDTSIAAFLTAICRGYDPAMCVALASAEGACCVTTYDALSGLKTIEELVEKIDSGWQTA
ncbi:MAG: carbohydrate kinase family protein [Lachnospiraceae bacterium]|nr:carbohydrate kinase family protein [Lachnospiraceae bacterium]